MEMSAESDHNWVVEHVQEHRDEWGDYEYLQQFEPDAEGVTFNDEIQFDRMREVYGLEPVWGGISGERNLRSMLDTELLEGGLTREDFGREWSNAQYNDLQNYHGWNVYDTLALRATEGESELIPRQEYEFLSFCWSANRWPEFFKLMIDTIGLDGIMQVGERARDELGTGMTSLLGWVYAGVPAGGAIGMDALGLVGEDDPVFTEQRKDYLKTAAAVQSACRGHDGCMYPSQTRYINPIKSDDTIDFVTDNLVDLEGATKANFRQFNAAAEMLSFLMHYDNRVGLIDNGPYFVDEGKPMVMRDILINRPFLPWNDIAADRDIPHGITIAAVIDPDELGLQEIRCPLTTFTAPQDYLSAVEKGGVFFRNDTDRPEDYPLADLEIPDFDDDLPDLAARLNAGVSEWYERAARLSRREKIINGALTYYVGMLVPLLRATGSYDYFRDELDLWEMPPMTSDIYYMMMDGVAQEEVPMMIMYGYGWKDFPDQDGLADTSQYAEYLEAAREMGWKSDLSGIQPVPDGLQDRMDGNNLLDVDRNQMEGDVEPRELGDHLESL